LSTVGHQEVRGTLVAKHIHDSLFHNPDTMCLNCKLNYKSKKCKYFKKWGI